jgi:hypothetical protein
MKKEEFLYDIGDLVQFTYGRLGAVAKKIGFVAEKNRKVTSDTLYKIKAGEKDYWIPTSRIELLSKVVKASSK